MKRMQGKTVKDESENEVSASVKLNKLQSNVGVI